MAEKNSFVIYNDFAEQTSLLTDDQLGKLVRAMLCWSKGGEPVIDDKLVAISFSFVRPTLERDRAKWLETCAKRQEAGRKGGRPRKNQTPADANPADGGGEFLRKNQKVFEKADTVNVTDTVTDTVTVPVTVKDSQDPAPVENLPDRQGCEKDYQDALAYAKKAGYTFTAKQRKKLRYFVNVFSFEIVIMAIDRAIFHGGKSPTYVLRILQEWRDKRLCDMDAITAYVEQREGGGAA